MNTNLSGVTIEPCETITGDYAVYFYPADHDRDTVTQEITENGYEITRKESLEHGELRVWFIE